MATDWKAVASVRLDQKTEMVEIPGNLGEFKSFVPGVIETVLWINGDFPEAKLGAVTVNGRRFIPDHDQQPEQPDK